MVADDLPYIIYLLDRFGVPASDVDDVAQDVLHGAYRAIFRFDPSRAKLRSWLYKIAFYQAQNFLGRAYRHHEVPLTDKLLKVLMDERPDAEQRLTTLEPWRTVCALIDTLAADRRAVLVAYAIEEKSMQAVAEILGIPITTGWSRLQAARKCLREGLKRSRRRRWSMSSRNPNCERGNVVDEASL